MREQLIYFIICFLQPIILPFPEPVTIVGGSSVLGPLRASIIGFSGTTLGIIVMFFIAKFASINIINKIVNEKKLDKFNKYIEKNDTLIILVLFILPILPDEVICIGAGLAKLNSYKFIVIAALSKLFTSISLAYSIELIKFNGNLIVILIVLIIFSIIIKRNKLSTR
ncbi:MULTISPECIES: VTT domain-containing protein [unclassified Clostridium]|uniref:TVP38/TMEM64 family protein n=1 Tax=unclassified Clostridium TaxID=2614128 RepID=UPI00291563FC|nr:VTT domain-containing protein [Clostridium sp.]MDU5108551.1 VTT domain-containing protein [Clostridium sp.]